ncbi:MAG: Sensor kinase CusS [candidate division WS2 bacterium ADurb.Bin280]|uniref:histidine kinase n=1 Tax=candidate division WS2 bacterium ADurb.Bin280 TaxID=1852829 RepID=A0A1V5SCG5_9BACT|nr:MAG: Sensor kinase CusS [candidate division WS2 bacterium ADurb.Bin280]
MQIPKINKLKISEFEKAAIKLSIFYVFIVMTISISFSVIIFNVSSIELTRGIGRTFRYLDQAAPERIFPSQSELEIARINQIEQINKSLKDKLTFLNLLILLLSSSICYFLAKKTLHPLELAMEAQSRFSSDVSHELRTPLAAMRTQIEVALRNKDTSKSEARDLLKSNLEEIAKLENLSGVLLRLENRKLKDFEFSKVDLSEVVTGAYQKLEALSSEKKIVFSNDLHSIFVQGDEEALVELFVILIDNAIKYSDDGKKVEIKIGSTHGKGFVSIKDYGKGIKASDLPRVFERFYRGDFSRSKNKIDGYGLGLSLAKQIADMHKAKIEVISEVGKGSEFIVRF